MKGCDEVSRIKWLLDPSDKLSCGSLFSILLTFKSKKNTSFKQCPILFSVTSEDVCAQHTSHMNIPTGGKKQIL